MFASRNDFDTYSDLEQETTFKDRAEHLTAFTIYMAKRLTVWTLMTIGGVVLFIAALGALIAVLARDSKSDAHTRIQLSDVTRVHSTGTLPPTLAIPTAIPPAAAETPRAVAPAPIIAGAEVPRAIAPEPIIAAAEMPRTVAPAPIIGTKPVSLTVELGTSSLTVTLEPGQTYSVSMTAAPNCVRVVPSPDDEGARFSLCADSAAAVTGPVQASQYRLLAPQGQ